MKRPQPLTPEQRRKLRRSWLLSGILAGAGILAGPLGARAAGAEPLPASVTRSAAVKAAPAALQPAAPSAPTATVAPPVAPTPPGTPDGRASLSIDLGGTGQPGRPSQSVTIIVMLTLLSVAPALLLMMTSFTRIVIVLSLTRNALGLQGIPPNQVLVGLALFLSLFVMQPTLDKVNTTAVQPYLRGEIAQGDAFKAGQAPMKEFMLKHTHRAELAMFVKASGAERPATAEDVKISAVIPAFILSELKTAFIIGFIIFIPFLVIDIIVSSSLMSMGMMMLPPVLVSLPFKMLLFVLVDGWALVVRSTLQSFS